MTVEHQPVKAEAKSENFLAKYWPLIVAIALMVAVTKGWITPEQAEKFRQQLPDISQPDQSHAGGESTGPVTPEQVAELIRKAREEERGKLSPPVPTPVVDPEPVPPAPPSPPPAPPVPPLEPARIVVSDEDGAAIVGGEVEAGQLFRVSAVGVSDSIGWHPVESGDVRMVASTDGKEYAGYLTSGQWVEFSLTDFNSKTQVSLRVTCLTAPQPPPEPDEDTKPDPRPEPKAKNVRVFVVYNPGRISPDDAIVLNANDMWDGFTASGSDWKFVDWKTEDEYEKVVVRDASGIGLPAVVVYDKSTGKKLTAEELPKSVIATEGLVERYTGGK